MIGHGQRLGGAGDRQRQTAALARDDAGADAAQRLGGARHRPAAQRGVAGEEDGDGMAGDDAHEEPRAGAGIAEIDDVLRLYEAADPDAVDMPAPRRLAVDLGAERAHRLGGAQHVLALEQAADMGAPDGERAQHQRAMRDRLVAGHADPAGELLRCSR